jgi:flagellar hook-basal body complex protein FliE
MSLPPILRDTPIDTSGLERYGSRGGIGGDIGSIRGLDGDSAGSVGNAGSGRVEGASFADTLTGALSRAGAEEKAADNAAERFANGDPGMGIHEVMIAAEKATISVRYAVTLKNKMLEAYKELMNTQL